MSVGDKTNARADKHALRAQVLAHLKNLPSALREVYSCDLRLQAGRFLSGDALDIALYAPMPHEVDLLPLLRTYPQHRFHFPRCLPGRKLEFKLVSDPALELEADLHGIPAPRPQLRSIAPERLDLLFVPGLAFTVTGHRLGYGGGYYDRYLPLCAQATKVACAFPEQIVEALPIEEHDLPVDSLLVAHCRHRESA